MSTTVKRETGSDQIVHLEVFQSAYDALAASLDDDHHHQLSFDGRILEIVSPSSRHEIIRARIADMIAAVRFEWRITLSPTGSATFRPVPPGFPFEADLSYYIEARSRVRDIKNLDLTVDPPLDLIIEVDITNRRKDKKSMYAAIGIPEFWRIDESAFEAFALENGDYLRTNTSRVISGLPLFELAKRAMSDDAENDIVAFDESWHQWLRDNRRLHSG